MYLTYKQASVFIDTSIRVSSKIHHQTTTNMYESNLHLILIIQDKDELQKHGDRIQD